MKKISFILLVILIPYIIMLITNEYVRTETFSKKIWGINIETINSDSYSKTKCTWACHNDSEFCEQYHIKNQNIHQIDNIYTGIIRFLKSGIFTTTEFNYGINNIIFLVILWPLWMMYMFIRVVFSFKK